MGFASFTELKDTIASTLNRDEAQLIAAIPDFITLAEARMRRVLKGKDARLRSTISIDTNGEYTLASGTKSVEYIYLTEDGLQADVEITTPNRVNIIRRQFAPGVPIVAAMVAGVLIFGPIPDRAYAAELIADVEITPLSVASPSNWVLANYPDLYLYGSLVHSAPFLREDNRIPTWKDFADAAYEELRLARDEAEFNGNTPIAHPISALGE
jgi:hypothetical protein